MDKTPQDDKPDISMTEHEGNNHLLRLLSSENPKLALEKMEGIYNKRFKVENTFFLKKLDYVDIAREHDVEKIWPAREARKFFLDKRVEHFARSQRASLIQSRPDNLVTGWRLGNEFYQNWMDKVLISQRRLRQAAVDPDAINGMKEHLGSLDRLWYRLYERLPQDMWDKIPDKSAIVKDDRGYYNLCHKPNHPKIDHKGRELSFVMHLDLQSQDFVDRLAKNLDLYQQGHSIRVVPVPSPVASPGYAEHMMAQIMQMIKKPGATKQNDNSKEGFTMTNKHGAHPNRYYNSRSVAGVLIAAKDNNIIIQDNEGKFFALAGATDEQAQNFFLETERLATYKRMMGDRFSAEEYYQAGAVHNTPLDNESLIKLENRTKKHYRDKQAFKSSLADMAYEGNAGVVVHGLVVGHDDTSQLKAGERRLDERKITYVDPRTGEKQEVEVLTGVYHSISLNYEAEQQKSLGTSLAFKNYHIKHQDIPKSQRPKLEKFESEVVASLTFNQDSYVKFKVEKLPPGVVEANKQEGGPKSNDFTISSKVESIIPIHKTAPFRVGDFSGEAEDPRNKVRRGLFNEIYKATHRAQYFDESIDDKAKSALRMEGTAVTLDLFGFTKEKQGPGEKTILKKQTAFGIRLQFDSLADGEQSGLDPQQQIMKNIENVINYQDPYSIARLGNPIYENGVRVGFDTDNSQYNKVRDFLTVSIKEMSKDLALAASQFIEKCKKDKDKVLDPKKVGDIPKNTPALLNRLERYISKEKDGRVTIRTSDLLHVQNWVKSNPSLAVALLKAYDPNHKDGKERAVKEVEKDNKTFRVGHHQLVNNIQIGLGYLAHIEDKFAGVEAFRATVRDHLIANDHFGTRPGEPLDLSLSYNKEKDSVIRIQGVNNRGHYSRDEVRELLGESTVALTDYGPGGEKKGVLVRVKRTGLTQKGLYAGYVMLHGMNPGGLVNDRALINNAGWRVVTSGLRRENFLTKKIGEVYEFKPFGGVNESLLKADPQGKSPAKPQQLDMNQVGNTNNVGNNNQNDKSNPPTSAAETIAEDLIKSLEFKAVARSLDDWLPEGMSELSGAMQNERAIKTAKTLGLTGGTYLDLLAGEKSSNMQNMSRGNILALSGQITAQFANRVEKRIFENRQGLQTLENSQTRNEVGPIPVTMTKSLVTGWDFGKEKSISTAPTELNPLLAQDNKYINSLEVADNLYASIIHDDSVNQQVFDQLTPYFDSLTQKDIHSLLKFRFEAGFDRGYKEEAPSNNRQAWEPAREWFRDSHEYRRDNQAPVVDYGVREDIQSFVIDSGARIDREVNRENGMDFNALTRQVKHPSLEDFNFFSDTPSYVEKGTGVEKEDDNKPEPGQKTRDDGMDMGY